MRAISKFFISVGVVLIIGAFALTGYNVWDINRAEQSVKSVMTILAAEVPDYTETDSPDDDYYIPDESSDSSESSDYSESADSSDSANSSESTESSDSFESGDTEGYDESDATIAGYDEVPDDESPDEIPLYELNPQIAMPETEVNGYEYIGILTIPSLYLELPIMSEWDYDRLKITACRYSGSVYTDDMVLAGHNYRSHFGGLKNLSYGDEVKFTDTEGNVFMYAVDEVEVLEPTAIEEMTTGDWDMTLFTCTLSGQTRIAIRLIRTDK